MSQNLFEELQIKKEGLVKMAAKAVEYGWISQERYQEIITKLDNDTLTIGVIGQMKCGKSTFLNFTCGYNAYDSGFVGHYLW